MLKRIAALAGALALCGSAHAAFQHVELAPGAGSLPGTTNILATAQNIPGSALDTLTAISGALTSQQPAAGTPVYEIDLYRLFIPDLGAFSAQAVSGNPGDDFALFLFDGSGVGIMMNDDTGAGLLPSLPTGIAGAAGFYYLAVSLGGVDALDALLDSVFNPGAFDAVRLGNGGLLDSFADPFARFSEFAFDYRIVLTGAGVTVTRVTEPASLLLLLAAALGLRAAARKTARG